MRKYEVMIIFDPEVESIDILKSFVSETFTNNNIKSLEENNLGLKDLSFPINEKRKGHYFLYNVETNTESLPEVEATFKLKKGILRYLIIRQN